MATPTLDGFGVLGGIAGSGSGTVPSLPVTPGGFPALLDAARQQTELVFWIVRTVQEHEGRISSLSRQLADQLKLLSEDRKIFKSASTRKWPSGGMGSRGLSRESFASNDGGVQSVLSQATGSPLHHESEAADKTQIEENLDMDLEHPDEPAEPAQPLEPAEPGEAESAEQGLEAGANGEAMAETEGASQSPDDRVEGSIASAEVRRMSFASGGRRRSSLTGPLPVDEATASNIVTEERLADRLEERIQQVLSQDVEARLEDVAQFVQEEIYRFVLGPQMMERVRHECSSVISMELAIALAAQDKKVEELIRSSLMGPLSHLESLPGQDVTDDLGRRLKLTEDLVGELKGLRLQVPDMRNELTNLQSSLMATVHTVEELEVRQEELAAAGAHRLSPVSPHRSSPSRAEAIDDEGLGVDDLGEAVGETGADGGSPTNAPSPAPQSRQPSRPPSRQPSRQPSVVASPDDMKPKRRLSDMLGLYMAPPAKPQAADDSQVQELAARTESMRTRLEQMEQIVGTEQAAVTSRRHSLQNKLNDVDTLAAILEDRMRELDMDFRASKQHVQSQLDVLTAAHEAQHAEDLKHNKTWNLANQVDVILSVVSNEMRSVRSEFDKKLNAALLHNIETDDQERARALSGEGPSARDMQDVEDKVKRLQDSQQQSMLKIAGLRSAHKHAEGQANFAVEKLKRLQAEVSNIVDQVVYQQSRLDYLLVHGAAMDHQKVDSGSFQAIVSVGEKDNKKPKLKAGATLPSRQMAERTAVPTDASAESAAGHMPDSSDEVNSSRIARLGKKLLDLDGQVNRGIAEVKADIESVNQTLLSFLEFLPRRLRRMLQKQLFPDPEEEAESTRAEARPNESRKHVNFSDHVETRTFLVEDDSRLPWQLVGEADIRWSWCFKPRDEMGKDLAMCLQQFDNDREEFEAKVVQWLQGGGVPVSSMPVRSSMALGSFRDSLSLDGLMSMSMGMGSIEEGVAPPQLMHLEERLERLGTEVFNMKRAQDVDHVRKVDKEDLQLVVARLGALEKFNIPDLKIRIEALEGDTKFSAQNLVELREKVFKVEAVAAPRSELAKVQNGFEELRSDHQAMKVELKEASASMYNANRKFIHELQEVKSWTQNSITVLHKQKVDSPDLAAITDKVLKLEQSIKDNRRILGDGGGQEINAVVRRIILNLEDKIMVLEKKIDALADGRPPKDIMPRNESPAHKHAVSHSSEVQEAALQSVSEELTAMTDAVARLKQDICVSKVHIDEMAEQGQQNLELASRLHVYVQSSSIEGMDDEGTALSLNRVQVMIAAAARQLVAGNKWITKEVFDGRLDQIRSEYLKELRQIQARLEDQSSSKALGVTPVVTVSSKLPKMMLQHVPNEATAAIHAEAPDRLGTAPASGTRPIPAIAIPLSARGGALRPSTVDSRPRKGRDR